MGSKNPQPYPSYVQNVTAFCSKLIYLFLEDNPPYVDLYIENKEMSELNRTWLIYANEKKCNHAEAIHNLGYISWAMGTKYKFAIGDTVYVFMSDERRVRFKMLVELEGVQREDCFYCISLSNDDITYRLRFVAEYNGNRLNENELVKRGFKSGRSIEKPSCKKGEYIDYIKFVFDSLDNPMSLDIVDRPMMVVDLFSGSYVNEFIGHETLNLEKDKKDGRYYGYCPPKDNVDISSLGAPKRAESISGVTVIYVKKQHFSNDREVIAFCVNATVHRKPQTDKSLNRYIGRKNEYCSYTIESDTMFNLMMEESKFVIKIKDYNNHMFRMQRFYKGKYPNLDKKLFEYLKSIISRNDVDDDSSFQFEIQAIDEVESSKIGDNSKVKPNFATDKSSFGITKNATVSKKALAAANYLCLGNSEHTTFKTEKGRPYMEGHHLIPCTYSNANYYWNQQGVNIDCQANIVCLCPTCHRLIHYGADDAKRALIELLYKGTKDKLRRIGLDLTLDELLRLYSL